MISRKLTVLAVITVILALAEFASAVSIGLGEDGPRPLGMALRRRIRPASGAVSGTRSSAENTRSSSRDDGPAVSQSKKPASRSPSITGLYGAASWWPTIHPGRIVRPVNHRSPLAHC